MAEKCFELFLLKHYGIAPGEDAETQAQPVDSFADIVRPAECVETFRLFCSQPLITKEEILKLCKQYHGELGFESQPYLHDLLLERSLKKFAAVVDVSSSEIESYIAYSMHRVF